MNVATRFLALSPDDLKAQLDGGTLTVYSVARPANADLPVDRSGVIATYKFASPAFGEAVDGVESPSFAANPVPAATVGTPGFARARNAEGATVADFSAGPGVREIKFAEVSCSPGAPVKIVEFRLLSPQSWPEAPRARLEKAAP